MGWGSVVSRLRRTVASYAPWIWLGLRLTIGGRHRSLMRTALLGLGTAAGIVLVLGALSVPFVVDAQADRVAARTPVAAEGETAPSLRIMVVEDAVAGRRLLRVAVSGVTAQAPVPPGVDHLPAPGEVVLSPALIELMANNAAARDRFPYRIVDTISEPGLVAPDELIAYVGVDESAMPPDAMAVASFGTVPVVTYTGRQGTYRFEHLLTPGRVAGFAFAFFLLAPLAVLLGACARLSATVRDQRLAALRILGASTRQAQVVNAVETGLVAAVGVAVGSAAFPPLARASGSWSFGRFHWFPEDIRVSPIAWLVASITIVVFAVVVAVAGAAPAAARPLATRRAGTSGAPSRWRPLAFGVAVAALLTSTVTGRWPSVRLLLFASGTVAAALTLPLVLPSLVYHLMTPAIRWRNAPVWLRLMARRVRHSPALVPRLVAGLAVAVFVGGVALIGAANYGREQRADRITDAAWLPQQVLHTNGDAARRLADVVGADNIGLHEYLGATTQDGTRHVAVIRATCHDLAVLFDTTAGCRDGASYRVAGRGEDLPVGAQISWTETSDDAVSADRVPAETIELGTSPFGLGAPDMIITEEPATGDILAKVAATPEALDRWYAAVAVAAPASFVQGYREVPSGFDAGAIITLIGVGLTISVAIGLVAFSVTTVDRSLSSRRANMPLTIVGVPRRLIWAAEAGQSLVAVAAGLSLASTLVGLTVWSWSRVFDQAVSDLVPGLLPLTLLGLGGIGAVTVAVVCASTRSGRPTPEILRHE